MSCSDAGLPGGTIFAFQMGSFADFQAALRNLNKWWRIDDRTAGAHCPPAAEHQGAAGHQGVGGWHDTYFPQQTSQYLEWSSIGSGRSARPAYLWAYPTGDAFLLAQAAPGTTFKDLDTWWTNDAGPTVSRCQPPDPCPLPGTGPKRPRAAVGWQVDSALSASEHSRRRRHERAMQRRPGAGSGS